MSTKKAGVTFKGTPEQEAKLMEIIAAHKEQPGALMPVLQQAQEVYGYLPIEVHHCRGSGHPAGRGVRRRYILLPVHSLPQGTVQDLCMSWHRLLCQGLRRRLRPSPAEARHQGR